MADSSRNMKPAYSAIAFQALWGCGIGQMCYAFDSIDPIPVGILVGLACYVVLYLSRIRVRNMLYIYSASSSVGCFMTGLSCMLSEVVFPHTSIAYDSENFFQLASGAARDLSLNEIAYLTEGSAMVVVWRWIYEAAESLGFTSQRYMGCLVNSGLVAMAVVVGARIVEIVYGHDEYRSRRFVWLSCACGMFWLFSAVHLRDALLLLVVTMLILFWIKWIACQRIEVAVSALALSVAIAPALHYVRAEFRFLPAALSVLALTSQLVGSGSKRAVRMLEAWSLSLGIIVLIVGTVMLRPDAIEVLVAGHQGYREGALLGAAEGSLGSVFIVNTVFPVRLILGSMYLLLFPIPFWIGFDGVSDYHLFKSCHVLFMYGVIPLFLLSISILMSNRSSWKGEIIFLLSVMVTGLFAVAGTSLETRHFGVFLIATIILCLIPDLRFKPLLLRYRQLLFGFLLIMACVHLLWIALRGR